MTRTSRRFALASSFLLLGSVAARADDWKPLEVDLAEYEKIDPENVRELRRLAREFKGRRLLHVNTTRDGGGVAEILNRMIPVLRAAGVETDWPLMKGEPAFFDLTKAMHNAIHGAELDMTDPKNRELYDRITEMNKAEMPPVSARDVVFVHDPQPAGLIDHFANQGADVFWRFHVDSSRADPRVLDFLRERTGKAYATGFHMPEFFFDTGNADVLLRPSIDPLHPKNVDMTRAEIKAALARYDVPLDGKPIVSQISRYDWLKDPLGVIEAYKKLREGGTDARLILAGPEAVSDDPEAKEVVDAVRARVKELEKTHPEIARDIRVLTTPYDAELINALQRASAVVMQLSTQEGFGLTVSEALWKGTPVVARPSGG
ncbi:MAG: glycosyltransferase, partial [Planctomycetota bacterium]